MNAQHSGFGRPLETPSARLCFGLGLAFTASSRGAFQPPPKVSSAVLEIRPRERPLAEDAVLLRAGALEPDAFREFALAANR